MLNGLQTFSESFLGHIECPEILVQFLEYISYCKYFPSNFIK